MLYVFNKIDKVDQEHLERIRQEFPKALLLSAKHKQSTKELLQKIEESALKNFIEIKISVPYQNTEALNYVYKKATVLHSDTASDGALRLAVRMHKEDFYRLEKLL